jgi:hypothetical protein
LIYSKKIEIYIPLMDVEAYKMNNVITELCSLSGKFHVRFKNKVIAPLLIEKLDKRKVEVKKIFKAYKAFKYIPYYLKFSSEYTILRKDLTRDLMKDVMTFDYFAESYIRHFLIYSNIAVPGAIDTREGIVVSKLTFGLYEEIESKRFNMLSNSIWNSINIARKYKWPTIQVLPIGETLSFLQDHWSAFENLPVNRLQRALNAFSYLFHDNLSDSTHIDLFYSLIGIEAIFVDGHDNVQKQVDRKSQILLGQRGEFKKLFNELYEFRSRYIHGQLNFLNRYYVDDIGDDVKSHVTKSYDNSSFATAILIASIQKQIQLRKNDLEFDIILKE